MTPPPPPTIVAILARIHSGSTLLELLLGGHTRVASLGEAKWLDRRFRERPHRRRCTCGRDAVSDCPFWRRVAAVLRERHALGLEDLDLGDPDPAEFVRHNRALFEAVAATKRADVVVDGTKELIRIRPLLASGAFDVRLVYLVRGAYGAVYSQVRRGVSVLKAVDGYQGALLAARRLLRGREHFVVRYEDLARDPRAVLERLMPWIGLPFEPEQLRWGAHEHHSVGGNEMRFERGGDIRPDLRWRRGLSLGQKLGIAALLLPSHLPGVERWAPAVARRLAPCSARAAGWLARRLGEDPPRGARAPAGRRPASPSPDDVSP